MVGVFCSHCFQACNFVAISLYQNIPKEIKIVDQERRLSFTNLAHCSATGSGIPLQTLDTSENDFL